MAEFGYAGEILKVDLSNGNATRLPTSEYADRFLGGRGIAAKLFWDMVPPQAGALDPENCLIFVTGPAAGFGKLASCRWQICGRSPAMKPEAFSYANLGGKWGSTLKYAGYDGLVVEGRSEKPVYLFISDGAVEIRDASPLWGKSAFEAADILKAELGKGVSLLAIGPAAENTVSFATILADGGASGSSGLGAVIGSKGLKAIAVAGNKRPIAADPDGLCHLGDRIYRLTRPSAPKLSWVIPGRTRDQFCPGCGIGCLRQSYSDESGNRMKSFCAATFVYQRPATEYYGQWSEVILQATRLCDKYGLDTRVMQTMIDWLSRCYGSGILKDEETGIPLSKIGSAEFIEALTRKIALREDFGDVLANGTLEAAETIGGKARDLLNDAAHSRASESLDYDPRLYLASPLLYATEPRIPIQQVHEASTPLLLWLSWHRGEKRGWFQRLVPDGVPFSTAAFQVAVANLWGSERAADFSSYEGKAFASKRIQDRVYARECLIVCDAVWKDLTWITEFASRDGGPVSDTILDSQIVEAVTGRQLGDGELNQIGERVFNLQRAILMRQGWEGRKGDRLPDYVHEHPLQPVRVNPECLVPGKDGEVKSRKGAVVVREEFEKMKSEYYELRGWDVDTGLQSNAKLRELHLEDVAVDLERRGLVK